MEKVRGGGGLALDLPEGFGLEIDVFFADFEAAGLEEVGDAFGAAHGLFEAMGEEFDVFFIAFEGEAAIADIASEFLVVAFDHIKEGATESDAHDGIDDELEGIGGGIGGDGFVGDVEVDVGE